MDVVSAILDMELGCVSFTVERITCTRTRSGTVSHSAVFQASGCIHPGTPEMIQLLPEEERSDSFIAVYTDCQPGVWYESGTGGCSGTARHTRSLCRRRHPHDL